MMVVVVVPSIAWNISDFEYGEDTESKCCCELLQLRNSLGPELLSDFSVQGFVRLFIDCLTPQQHATLSRRWVCPDSLTYCHTEIQVADQTFFRQSQYTHAAPASPSAGPITPGAWQVVQGIGLHNVPWGLWGCTTQVVCCV